MYAAILEATAVRANPPLEDTYVSVSLACTRGGGVVSEVHWDLCLNSVHYTTQQ